METLRLLLALAGIVAVVALLIMKKDTKTVLIGVGLVLCVLCLKPLDGLSAFTSYMTKAGLIKAICASMGFAFVMKFTGCDRALIRLLTRPLGNLGFLLIPIVVALTYFINIAIPSAAGCSAAVGATMIPLLMAAGIKPEMAGAAVFAGTFGGVLSPGSAHNVFVADMVKAHNPSYTVQDVIAVQFSSAITALIVVLIVISITAIVCKDYTRGGELSSAKRKFRRCRRRKLHCGKPCRIRRRFKFGRAAPEAKRLARTYAASAFGDLNHRRYVQAQRDLLS